MNLIIFGAAGNLGQRVVKLALKQGWAVTAFVHRTTLPFNHSLLTIVRGSVFDQPSVDRAIEKQEAVVSTLGMPLFGRRLICAEGIEKIIAAMKRHGVQRLVAVSAFGANEHRSYNLYTRHLRWVIPKHMADKDAMEQKIKASSLDWTIIRPAAYFDLWPSDHYVIEDRLKGWYPVSTRRAVADFIIEVLKSNRYLNQTPAIRYGRG